MTCRFAAVVRGCLLAFPVLATLVAPGWAQAPAGGNVSAAPPVDVAAPGSAVTVSHGIAMHGALKYPAGFHHFDYVNPAAPKGGTLKMYSLGGFDSFNAFIVKGTPAPGVGMLFDTLLVSAADEAFSEYGLLAETIEAPENRAWVAFTLRKQARFHDGTPVTAEDVVFSFNTLREKGDPFYRLYYANVTKVEAEGPLKVRFTFDGADNRELPLILGQMPVLSKAYWKTRDFSASTLDAPVGSGPYRVKAFEAGRYVVYERVKDWWAKDLAVVKGQYNFDEIRYDVFRDETVALEAFKAGAYDLRTEAVAKQWATAYEFPARAEGKVRLKLFENHMPSGMQGFVFNQRRPMFEDPRVREALGYAFDFEWANQNLFYGQYTRTRSYFDNSELAATGLPSPEELKLLAPWRGKIPEEVFTKIYMPPTTEGTGSQRANLRYALDLLQQAGWDVKNGVLTNAKTGKAMSFEILLGSPTFERVVLPYVQNLKRLGITATVRTVDAAQYQNRVKSYDFDMVVMVWGQSMSPGNEQREFWGSGAADQPGSRNIAGLKNPAVDALIDAVVKAQTREELITATRALDRVLQWSYLVVPHWHFPATRLAWWDRFGMPDVVPDKGVDLMTWWAKPQ